jgi:hypothetical protein
VSSRLETAQKVGPLVNAFHEPLDTQRDDTERYVPTKPWQFCTAPPTFFTAPVWLYTCFCPGSQ